MTDTDGEPIVVGRITAPFGVKGWVKVHSYTDPPENIFRYGRLCRRRGGQLEPLELLAHGGSGSALTAHFAGCDDRDAAAALARTDLVVDAAALPALEQGEYYWHQLIGLKVLARHEGTPEVLLGEVDHLLETGANDVLVVKGTAESVDQRERLIPWLPGQVVLEVDPEAGQIVVDWDPAF